MLISAEGHIKLTDFGLAKLNMNFGERFLLHRLHTTRAQPWVQNRYTYY